MTYELDKLENKQAVCVGMVSCVGYMHMKFPAHHGNYFELCLTDTAFGGYEIANFWYEDLKHLLDTGVVKFPITIKVLEGRWAIIHDAQIPEEYYSETSYRAPDKYKSVTQRAKRQLKIDTGEVKIINGNDFNLEVQEIKATRRTLNVKWTTEPMLRPDSFGNAFGDNFKFPSK